MINESPSQAQEVDKQKLADTMLMQLAEKRQQQLEAREKRAKEFEESLKSLKEWGASEEQLRRLTDEHKESGKAEEREADLFANTIIDLLQGTTKLLKVGSPLIPSLSPEPVPIRVDEMSTDVFEENAAEAQKIITQLKQASSIEDIMMNLDKLVTVDFTFKNISDSHEIDPRNIMLAISNAESIVAKANNKDAFQELQQALRLIPQVFSIHERVSRSLEVRLAHKLLDKDKSSIDEVLFALNLLEEHYNSPEFKLALNDIKNAVKSTTEVDVLENLKGVRDKNVKTKVYYGMRKLLEPKGLGSLFSRWKTPEDIVLQYDRYKALMEN